jgi:hypothetical protein
MITHSWAAFVRFLLEETCIPTPAGLGAFGHDKAVFVRGARNYVEERLMILPLSGSRSGLHTYASLACIYWVFWYWPARLSLPCFRQASTCAPGARFNRERFGFWTRAFATSRRWIRDMAGVCMVQPQRQQAPPSSQAKQRLRPSEAAARKQVQDVCIYVKSL